MKFKPYAEKIGINYEELELRAVAKDPTLFHRKVSGVEVNGPANIIMLVEAMELTNAISHADANLLKEEAEKVMKYIKLLDNPNKVNWSDIC